MNRYLDWFEQAQRDLERAKLDVQYEFWEWACFTSQQAAEKAVKAVLMFHNVSVWGHGISAILRRQEILTIPPDMMTKAQLLDAHYIPARYPNGFPTGKPADYYNAQKAQEALDAASDILRFCEAYFTEPEQAA